MDVFNARVYTNGKQIQLSKEAVGLWELTPGQYLTLAVAKNGEDAIFTSKISDRYIITLPRWAVRVLEIRPGDTVEVKILRKY